MRQRLLNLIDRMPAPVVYGILFTYIALFWVAIALSIVVITQ